MTRAVILHNIRSAHNVGSIFRTADAAGVSTIFLSGYTPAPFDRFGRENAEIVKTSLGATKTVPYEVCSDIHALMIKLKGEGYGVVCVEQTDKAVPYTEFPAPEKTVFVFGNEVTGIDDAVLQEAHAHIHLPMRGMKESLNVSVCAGIVLFHFRE